MAHTVLADTFSRMAELGKRLADDRVLAHGFHRGIALDGQPDDVGEISAYRNGQIQLLAHNKVTVGNTLSSAGDHAVLDGQFVFRRAQFGRRKIKQRLVCIGGHLAKIRGTVVKEAERAAAVGSLVGRSGDDGGNGLEGHRQLFSNDLPVGSVDRALAEVVFPRADSYGAVRVDFEPGTSQGRVEGILSDGRFRRIAAEMARDQRR